MPTYFRILSLGLAYPFNCCSIVNEDNKTMHIDTNIFMLLPKPSSTLLEVEESLNFPYFFPRKATIYNEISVLSQTEKGFKRCSFYLFSD